MQTSKSNPKVLLAVPNGRGWIHKHVHFATMKLMQDRRVDTKHICPTHSPYVNNLHLIQKDFLAGDYDYLLTMDDDNPPTKNVYDLIELDKDVMVFPTPVWHNSVPGDRPFYHNVMIEKGEGYIPLQDSEHFRGVGLYEIDAGGSGCMLIARRVLEALKAPFMRIWNEDGTVEYGGDFSFCKRAKEAGFSIWTHLDYPCLHFKEIELTEVIQSIMSITDA